MSAPRREEEKEEQAAHAAAQEEENETKRKEERNEESFSARHSAGLDARDGCRRIRIRALDKPSEFAYAYDFDGSVLSNSTKTTIEQYGAALEEATGIQTIAVVVDFLDGEDPADYATDIINSWGVGQSGENNGVVVLLARGDLQNPDRHGHRR